MPSLRQASAATSGRVGSPRTAETPWFFSQRAAAWDAMRERRTRRESNSMTNVADHRSRTVNEIVAGGANQVAATIRKAAAEAEQGNLAVASILLRDVQSAIDELRSKQGLKKRRSYRPS